MGSPKIKDLIRCYCGLSGLVEAYQALFIVWGGCILGPRSSHDEGPYRTFEDSVCFLHKASDEPQLEGTDAKTEP